MARIDRRGCLARLRRRRAAAGDPAVASCGRLPVIWLNWANRPDRLNLPANVLHVYDGDGTGGGIGDRKGSSEAVLTEGSWGAAIVDGLDVTAVDIHPGKYRMSGFWMPLPPQAFPPPAQ